MPRTLRRGPVKSRVRKQLRKRRIMGMQLQIKEASKRRATRRRIPPVPPGGRVILIPLSPAPV